MQRHSRIEIVLWTLSLAASAITGLISLWTKAAVAETKVELLREMNEGFPRRTEFDDLRTRVERHMELNRHGTP